MEEIFQFHLDIPYSFLHKNEGPPCFLGLEKDTEVGNAIRLTEKSECKNIWFRHLYVHVGRLLAKVYGQKNIFHDKC
jgi:hypothetical protein